VINYISNEDLIENIKAFCSAYTKDSVKNQIDAMQKSVSGTILLASANKASTFDDIDTVVYNWINYWHSGVTICPKNLRN